MGHFFLQRTFGMAGIFHQRTDSRQGGLLSDSLYLGVTITTHYKSALDDLLTALLLNRNGLTSDDGLVHRKVIRSN
jgi:hypothetical protein